MSIQNGGGIRDSIGLIVQSPDTNDPALVQFLPPHTNPDVGKDVGGASQLDIKYTLRFNNGLVIVEVNAAQLLSVMERSIGLDGVGKVTAGRFPQVSGMRFSFDPTALPGDHIRSLAIVDNTGEVSDRVVEGGEPVGDSERTIKVVTLDYLADGGDYFPFPSPANGRLDLAEEMADLGEGLATFAVREPSRMPLLNTWSPNSRKLLSNRPTPPASRTAESRTWAYPAFWTRF